MMGSGKGRFSLLGGLFFVRRLDYVVHPYIHPDLFLYVFLS